MSENILALLLNLLLKKAMVDVNIAVKHVKDKVNIYWFKLIIQQHQVSII